MRGDSRPPILTPAKPREGAAAVAAAATGRPSSPPAPPPPPAPTCRPLRRPPEPPEAADPGAAGGLPLVVRVAHGGRGSRRGNPSEAQRAPPPGPQPWEASRETRGRPPQTPPAPARPHPRALQPMARAGAGQAEGRGLASVP